MLFFNQILAQENQASTHHYYIEEASNDLLNPTKIIENQDRTLTLEFADESITSFFAGFTILLYVREFQWSTDPKYHKYYLIGLETEDKTQDLEVSSSIVNVYYAGTMELNTLGTPDDYYDHVNMPQFWAPYPSPPGNQKINNPKAYEHLELVNARRAWNITQGDSTVVIGIRDVQFINSHPDINNKIVASVGSDNGDDIYSHGLSVAGIAAAETNNGQGISAIGYKSKIITITQYGHAGAVLYLAQNYPQVKVVNISLGSTGNPNPVEADIFQDVWDNYGVTVTVAAGNGLVQGALVDPNLYHYPASYDHVISVSSVGSYYKYGHLNHNDIAHEWKDVHQPAIGYPTFTHQHNDKVDIVAPGYSVPLPKGFTGYRLSWGTSYAAPMVAGTVALMHDVYLDIHPDDVKRILQETAEDKIYDIPENQDYLGKLGAGRLNAYGALLKAKCEYEGNPIGLDLNMQNTREDFGHESDTISDFIWNSPDIWVRNTNDGFLYKESEDLKFIDNQTPVYVYVRVTNDSCNPSTGTEQLELYWAKGGLQQIWPNVWNGSANGNLPIGGAVDTLTIPTINTGKNEILEFQ